MIHKNRVVIVKNILPPYRVYLFNEINKNLVDKDLIICLMSLSEKGRFWVIDEENVNFNFKIFKGLYKYVLNKFHFHFNPSLLYYLVTNQPQKVILGASWNNINIVSLVFLKRLGLIKSKFSFWSEANYLSETISTSFLKTNIRKFVLNTCDGEFIIPGKMSEITLFEKWNIKRKKTVLLPNLIDEKVFAKNKDKTLNKQNNDKIILIIARLIESKKGIINFLSSINFHEGFQIRIAGDGQDYDMVVNYIKKNNLENQVFLLGNLEQKEIIKEYIKADIFLLPSFQDPSPLTLVEASFMELPILVSKSCGNHYEIIEEGKNGFLFDPNNKNEIASKFKEIINKSKEELSEMGKHSYDIVMKNYKVDLVIKKFIEQVFYENNH